MKNQKNQNSATLKQQYTSADTSINSAKLPRVYSVARDIMTGSVIDYGCGKYFDLYGLPGNFYGYDPFNRDLPELLNRHYDTAVCSNVLNVIKEDAVRRDLLQTLQSIADTVIITVYEGNRSGVGKPTKKDCYQLNRRLCDYIPEVVSVFGAGNVRLYRGCLVCTR